MDQSGDNPEFVSGERAIAGVELSVRGIQAVARRQLIGSIVVAAFLAAVAGLMATRPAHREIAAASDHHLSMARQPTLAVPPDRSIAAVRRQNEVP